MSNAKSDISLRMIFWQVFVIIFGSAVAYIKFTPIIDMYVIIVYGVLILFWCWLPILIMHWYWWDKGKRDG